ncbi:peptidase A4 family-domain-containing protein [Xylariaceae sp. FL1019]|nr:peptidase A4 family-domain-containing protein [Xylariaceae sp. FL1019]
MAWAGVALCALPGPVNLSAKHHLEKMPRDSVNHTQSIQISNSKNTGVEGDVITTINWAGAGISSGADTYSSVIAMMNVPLPYSSGTPSAASVWVGLDGITCRSTMLQTGFQINVNASGWTSYSAWYRWFPSDAGYFDGFGLNPGDQIVMSVFADSPNSGFALVENLSAKNAGIKRFENQTSPICGQDAAWMVEDPFITNDSGVLPFTDFMTVNFTSAVASKGNTSSSLDGATIFTIAQNGKTFTDCVIDSSEAHDAGFTAEWPCVAGG